METFVCKNNCEFTILSWRNEIINKKMNNKQKENKYYNYAFPTGSVYGFGIKRR